MSDELSDAELVDKIKRTLNPEHLGISPARWRQFCRKLDALVPAVKSEKELVIHIDGGSRGNPGPAGIGIIVDDARGQRLQEHSEHIGKCTNNVAEYRALIQALQIAQSLGGKLITLYTDSELVAHQMNGRYRVKNAQLLALYTEAKALSREFATLSIRPVPREKNREADRLVNMALDGAGL